MPKVSIYLPDDLCREAKDPDLPLSSLAQEAIERAVTAARTNAWVARMRSRPLRVGPIFDTSALMDEVREEFGA